MLYSLPATVPLSQPLWHHKQKRAVMAEGQQQQHMKPDRQPTLCDKRLLASLFTTCESLYKVFTTNVIVDSNVKNNDDNNDLANRNAEK
jgi:hypothetical protein